MNLEVLQLKAQAYDLYGEISIAVQQVAGLNARIQDLNAQVREIESTIDSITAPDSPEQILQQKNSLE